MFTRQREQYPKVAKRLYKVLKDKPCGVVRTNGYLVTHRAMDSRDEAWKAIRQFISENVPDEPIAIYLDHKGLDEPFSCPKCNDAYLDALDVTLFESEFYKGDNRHWGDMDKMFHPAKRSLDFVDEMVRNPRLPKCKDQACLRNPEIKPGAFLVTVKISFNDIYLSVCYYME